jgi:hypothetical protein
MSGALTSENEGALYVETASFLIISILLLAISLFVRERADIKPGVDEPALGIRTPLR